MILPAPGAALDIGEQEGDGPGGRRDARAGGHRKGGGRRREVGQRGRLGGAVAARLTAGEADEGGVVLSGQRQLLSQLLGDLARGAQFVCLDLADGDDRVADAAGELGLGQVEFQAAAFEPAAKGQVDARKPPSSMGTR